MKNILPGSISTPSIEVSFGSFTISRDRMLAIINTLNRRLTGRNVLTDA